MKRRTLLSALFSLPAIALAGPHGPSTSRSRAGGPLDPRRRDDQEDAHKQESEKSDDVQVQGDDKPTEDDKGILKD